MLRERGNKMFVEETKLQQLPYIRRANEGYKSVS